MLKIRSLIVKNDQIFLTLLKMLKMEVDDDNEDIDNLMQNLEVSSFNYENSVREIYEKYHMTLKWNIYLDLYNIEQNNYWYLKPHSFQGINNIGFMVPHLTNEIYNYITYSWYDLWLAMDLLYVHNCTINAFLLKTNTISKIYVRGDCIYFEVM